MIQSLTLRIFLCLVFLFTGIGEAHAATTLSLIPSRTSGVAPLAVFFDAASTTADGITYPFHELDYAWNFGDTSAGVWTYGTASTSKNVAYGPESAHVFETPGTYTVTLSVYDGTATVTDTVVITVTDPDVVFGGTNTVCVSTSGTFTGCPSGAITNTTSSFVTALNYIDSSHKRLLFNRGETWTSTSSKTIVTSGAGVIGSYGTGISPIVSTTENDGNAVLVFTGSDWRVMDVTITNASTSLYVMGGIRVGFNTAQITLLRTSIVGTYLGFNFYCRSCIWWCGWRKYLWRSYTISNNGESF
jgi:hypothetical protein